MKVALTILYLSLSCSLLKAQPAKILKAGQITFMKTVNLYALGKKMSLPQNVYEDYKKNHQQFLTLKSKLYFSDQQTVFVPDAVSNENEAAVFNNVPFPFASQRNQVFTDWSSNSVTLQKKLLEDVVSMRDTIGKIKWKITDEFRDVAGFSCRRANAIIMDSMYVVAFFTNEIHVSGGPESFTGLPGMILEVALPHLNVIWRATAVTENKGLADEKEFPKVNKPLNRKQLREKVLLNVKSFQPPLRYLLLYDLLI
jgi:GLPGLI family protein